jgi:hypothetical protein
MGVWQTFKGGEAMVVLNALKLKKGGWQASVVMALLLGALLPGCLREKVDELLYEPVVEFEGIINDSAMVLPGHLLQPNRCFSDNDTLKIFCCSADYAPDEVPVGVYFWLHIYPEHDTLAAPTDHINKRRALLKVTYHLPGASSCSYQVSPADSVRLGAVFELDVVQMGGAVHFENIFATASPIGSYCPFSLKLREGTVRGHIQ